MQLRLLSLALAGTLTPVTAAAQLPRHDTVSSPTNDPDYGRGATGLGDLDGDGLSEFAVAETSTAAFQPPGTVFVYSGADASLLRTHQGIGPADGYGLSLAALGDVDGDGVSDYGIGAFDDGTVARGAGRAEVRSGADGSLVYEYLGQEFLGHLGESVAAAGDVDGDGRADFLIAEPGADRFRLHSGIDGSTIRLFPKPDPVYQSYPDSLAGAGDLDGDGIGDVVTGEIRISTGGNSNVGAVEALSTATGARLWRVLGDDDQEQVGRTVAGGVDVNGDGVPDVLGGAMGDEEPGSGSPGGSLTVFSGMDGSVLHEEYGHPGSAVRLGFGCAFVGDAHPSTRVKSFVFDAGGEVSFGLSLLHAGLDGTTWFCQGVEMVATQPLVLASSNGLEVRFTD